MAARPMGVARQGHFHSAYSRPLMAALPGNPLSSWAQFLALLVVLVTRTISFVNPMDQEKCK